MAYGRYRRRTFRRRYSGPKRYRKKYGGRGYTRTRISRKTRQPVQYFTRHANLGSITYNSATGVTSTDGVIYFTLSQLTNASDYATIYDQYKIKAVKVSFIPHTNVTYGSGQVSAYSNRLLTCLDFNDETVLSPNAIRQYQTCRVCPNNKIHTRYFYPKPLAEYAQNISGTTVLATKGSPWFSAQNNRDVRYYSIKYSVDHPDSTGFTTGDVLYRVECKYYLSFRGKQ